VVQRDALSDALSMLAEGDTLVVTSVTTLGPLPTALQTLADLGHRGIAFRCLDAPALNTDGTAGGLVARVFDALAATAAPTRARSVGRKPKTITDATVRLACAMHADPTLRVSEICERLGISRATFYRYVKLGRAGSEEDPSAMGGS